MSASHPCWPGTLAWRQAGTRREGPPRTSQPGMCLPHLIPARILAHPSAACSDLLNGPTLARRQRRGPPAEVRFRAVCRKHGISVPFCLFMLPDFSSSPFDSILSQSLSVSVLLSLSLSDPTLTPTPSLSFESPHSGPSTCSGNHSCPWPHVSSPIRWHQNLAPGQVCRRPWVISSVQLIRSIQGGSHRL